MRICCGSETRDFGSDSCEFRIKAVLIQVYLTGKSPTALQGSLTGDPSETVRDATKETMTGFTENKKKYKVRSGVNSNRKCASLFPTHSEGQSP